MAKSTTKSSAKKKPEKQKSPKTPKAPKLKQNEALRQEAEVVEAAQKKKAVPEVVPFQKMEFEQQMERIFTTLPSSETGEQVKKSSDTGTADAVMPKPESEVKYKAVKAKHGEFRIYEK